MQHERGHSHYRRLPQQTSTSSLFIFYSSISFYFLQLSSLSVHPSSAWFTPLILDCLPFLLLEKLALDGQSALTEEIWVQWNSVVSCVRLSNHNTYNSSRLSTHCLWICIVALGEKERKQHILGFWFYTMFGHIYFFIQSFQIYTCYTCAFVHVLLSLEFCMDPNPAHTHKFKPWNDYTMSLPFFHRKLYINLQYMTRTNTDN